MIVVVRKLKEAKGGNPRQLVWYDSKMTKEERLLNNYLYWRYEYNRGNLKTELCQST